MSAAVAEPHASATGWGRKDLLGIEPLSVEEIAVVLDRAESFRVGGGRSGGPASAPSAGGGAAIPSTASASGGPGSEGRAAAAAPASGSASASATSSASAPTDALAGRTVARLFFPDGAAVATDPHAATSWDLAARRLGGDVLEVTAGAADGHDGGALDSALDLDGLGMDVLVVRHPHAGVPAALARRVRTGVVNAGDGAHEDPVAALALALTLRRRLGALEGRRVALLGDVTHSAVARSLSWLLGKVGAEGTVGGLHALVPPAVESLGVRHAATPDEAVDGAEAVVVLPPAPAVRDGRTYPSAREYHRVAGLTAERLARAAPGAAVLHARPVTRGLEIAGEVAASPVSTLAEQSGDALAVRMAVLSLLVEAAAGGGE